MRAWIEQTAMGEVESGRESGMVYVGASEE